MSVQTARRQTQQQPPVQAVTETAQVTTKDPWSLPTIEVTFSQLPSSRWTAARTLRWQGLDLESESALAEIQTSLETLDEVIRQHMAELYEKDSIERDAYFNRKQQQGGYNDGRY